MEPIEGVDEEQEHWINARALELLKEHPDWRVLQAIESAKAEWDAAQDAC